MKSFEMRKPVQFVSIIAALAILGGCAAGASREGMTAGDYTPATKHDKSVSVKVGGGQQTSSLGKSQISDEEFTAALVASINKSKAFSTVVQGSGGDYELSVGILGMDQPSFGMNFTVKMEAGWTLKNSKTGAVVWQKVIKSQHTATPGDAFVGTERLRLANEGAARNNIKQGLAEIAGLKL